MSQRDSGYARIERDAYETPEWVTNALLPHVPKVTVVWEPACGTGKMQRALEQANIQVIGTDIVTGNDFLAWKTHRMFEAIITNPPYDVADRFVQRAIELTEEDRGYVAMLLRTDFDHGKTRAKFFGACKLFSKKVVLTKRIKWFDGKPYANPSYNHAWFVWDHRHEGPPTLAYTS